MGYKARNDEIRDNVTRMQREWEAQRGALATVRRFDPILSARGYSWFWPKIAAALISKHHWLITACDSCGTVVDLDLRVKPRDRRPASDWFARCSALAFTAATACLFPTCLPLNARAPLGLPSFTPRALADARAAFVRSLISPARSEVNKATWAPARPELALTPATRPRGSGGCWGALLESVEYFDDKKAFKRVKEYSWQLSRDRVVSMVNNFHCYPSEILQEVMRKKHEILRSSEQLTTEEALQFNRV
jgi:hypothetical protein